MAITVGSTRSSSALFSAAGIGSGLDVDSLGSQLVAAKKKPQQDQIDAQTSKAQTQISALGQVSAALSALKSALSPLSDGSALAAHAVAIGDTSVLSATARTDAVNGTYKIEVTKLAGAMKASSGAFADSDATVGTGTLTIAVGDKQMSLDIDADHASLAQIRDAINKSSDNPGVSATIVTGTDGAHLVLPGTRTGTDNGFSGTACGGDGGLSALI